MTSAGASKSPRPGRAARQSRAGAAASAGAWRSKKPQAKPATPPQSQGVRRRVSLRDLEELDPSHMYGASFGPLCRAVLRFLAMFFGSVKIVAGVVLTWRDRLLILLAASAIVLLFVLLPVSLLMLAVSLACCEVAWQVWLRRTARGLRRVGAVEDRVLPPRGATDVFRRTMEVVDMEHAWAEEPLSKVGRTRQQWLSGWFQGASVSRIKRDDMWDFLCFAWFCKQPHEMTASENKEAEPMLAELIQCLNLDLAPGREEGVRPIRVNFDCLQPMYFPLIYYASIIALNAATRSALRMLGFTYYPQSGPRGVSFYHCPQRPAIGELVVDGESVSRPSSSPVVFVHGLGVGLAPYLRLIRWLQRHHPVLVVELPEISQVVCSTVLKPTEMVEALAGMLSGLGYTRAKFAAHSYGTFVLSWVLRQRPDLVERVLMIDPVNLLLAQPDVASNVLYASPKNPLDLFVIMFVRREIFAANALTRGFNWQHNVLWRDELPDDTVVVLSGRDSVGDTWAMRRYLQDHQRYLSGLPGRGGKLKVLFLEDFAHGEALMHTDALREILALF